MDWLRAQLDADTLAAVDGTQGQWLHEPDRVYAQFGDMGSTFVVDDQHARGTDLKHIAMWSPRRALAEIAAKREVLRHHSPKPAEKHPGYDCLWCGMAYPCFDAKALAQPYRDRPGFREEWAL